MSTATAAWDLDVLVGSLARAGWGPLHDEIRGARTILKALADVLPHGSAHGVSTAAQLARVADMSERWTRHCLEILERAGVLRWRRGWRRVPGRFTLCKRTLARWIREARKANQATKPPADTRDGRRRRGRGRPTQPRRPAAPGRSPFKPEVASGLTFTSEVTAAALTGAPPGTSRPSSATGQKSAPQRGAPPPPQSIPADPDHRRQALAEIRRILKDTKGRRR